MNYPCRICWVSKTFCVRFWGASALTNDNQNQISLVLYHTFDSVKTRCIMILRRMIYFEKTEYVIRTETTLIYRTGQRTIEINGIFLSLSINVYLNDILSFPHRFKLVASWTIDHYHVSSNLSVGISEGCFIFDFASLPLS